MLAAQRTLRLAEQPVHDPELLLHRLDRAPLAIRGAQLAHGALDTRHQGCVARAQHRLQRLEAVQIGGEREFGRGAAVAGP